MTCEEKIWELRQIIEEQLTPLINNYYVLYDLPYYSNIGDLLIWEGELSFLKGLPFKMLECGSAFTSNLKRKIKKDTIILLQGGGNFGDIWDIHEFKRKVIRNYPENRIIIFPQTVFYQKNENMLRDIELMSRHPYLTICARDIHSFEVLKKNFKNTILLVPDMAFCIPYENLQKYLQPTQNKTLYVKRKDKELCKENISFSPLFNLFESDWPSYEQVTWEEKGLKLAYKFRHLGLSSIIDLYAFYILRPQLIRKGIEFVSQYREIYTTRLHVFILSILLGKSCTIIDNSYGKNSSFYETWLKNVDGIILHK